MLFVPILFQFVLDDLYLNHSPFDSMAERLVPFIGTVEGQWARGPEFFPVPAIAGAIGF